MRALKQSWAILSLAVLASCSYGRHQFFIFSRYDLETSSWSYYKTDLYAPARIQALEIDPCYSEDSRIQPTWSPNGEYYGCSAVHDQPLIIYDIDGRVSAELPQGNADDPLHWEIAGWSPDGQYVSLANTGSAATPYHDFSVMRFDGTAFRQLYTHPAAMFSDSSWSPDGRHILLEVTPYKDGQSILIIFEAAGNRVAEYALSRFIESPIVAAEQIIWSPDGKKLAFRTYYNMDVDSKLYVLDLETGDVVDVIPERSICVVGISGWSPDGRKILFDAIDCDKHLSGDYFDRVYFSIKADGSELTQLTEKGRGSLNWTPDGKSILVSGYGIDQSDRGMYIMNTDATHKRLLLEEGWFVSWITP